MGPSWRRLDQRPCILRILCSKKCSQWFAVVRYDCSHGFLHRDVMFPGGKKEKHPLDIPDLKTGLLYAEQDIKDRWKWYRDRFRRRLKK
uniref:DUF7718 family protein n=1 Tax=Candidatus Electrothrix sp. TaxID=2170559 RepID=UPI0040562901